LVFPTTQTYNDGEVVQWDEPTPASGEEPEHPAPTLTVGPVATTTPATEPSVAAVAATTSSGSDSTATILAAVSLVIAAAALVVAAVALRRRPENREG
jgi:hypothetical protein